LARNRNPQPRASANVHWHRVSAGLEWPGWAGTMMVAEALGARVADWTAFEVPEGLGWLRPHRDDLVQAYLRCRAHGEPVGAFEEAIADVLDDEDYERLEAFFDGAHDGVFGKGAGERARAELRDALETIRAGRAETGLAAGDGAGLAGTQGEVVAVERFYDEDSRRRASEEVSFGDHWCYGRLLVRWAVSWIADTGELISVGPNVFVAPHTSVLMDVAKGARAATSGSDARARISEIWLADTESANVVEVLAVDADPGHIEFLLGGWREAQDQPDSYLWLRERLGLSTTFR
jgi:hypothetical protein